MFVLVSILLLLAPTHAQFGTCETFAGSPPLCLGLFAGPIWVPPGYSQQNLSKTLVAAGAQATVLLPGKCARLAAQMACSQTFRLCGQDGLPVPLCPELCSAANQACLGSATFDCTAPDPILAPAPLWLVGSNRTGVEQSCQVANASSPEIRCPYPFIANPAVDRCTIKCPPTGIDNGHINDAIWIVLRVLAPISILFCLLIIPPLWTSRQGPNGQRYLVWWWICMLVSSCCDLLGKWDSWESYICADKWTVKTQSYTICGLAVIGPYLFRNASVFWITAIMYNTVTGIEGWGKFRLFGPRGRLPYISESLAYHFLIWTPPTVSLFIAYLKRWVSANGGPFTCYILTEANNGWSANFMTIIPLTVGLALSTILMSIIFFYIVRVGRTFAKQQWRILFMSVTYTLVVLIVIVFSWITFAQRGDIKASVVDFLTCVAFNGDQKYCPPLNNPLNTNLQMVSISFSAAVPIVVGVAYLDRQVFDFWRQFLTHVYHPGSASLERGTSGGSLSASRTSTGL